MAEIVYGREDLIESFYVALGEVAREEIYIEMIEPPEYEDVLSFQTELIENNWPVFYAVNKDQVVGWIDISVASNPRMTHRGFLGMGVKKEYRGQGIGKSLLERALNHSKSIGLEKIELTVYTDNKSAVGLYKKYGFTEVGTNKHFRKIGDKYFDAYLMELFF